MLVDLVTPEKELEELMISEYPEILKEKQIVKSRNNNRKIYGFFGLDYLELTVFFINFFGVEYEFKIFENRTTRFIEDNHTFINPHSYL